MKDNSGQILVEVLVAMAVAAGVMVLGSQLIYVSLVGNKISEEMDVATSLGAEVFAGVQSIAAGNWNNIDSLSHGITQYYPQKSAGAWVVAAGAESIPMNNALYNRFFTIQNVCRDITTRSIVGVTDSDGSSLTCNDISNSRPDPSTQKINVAVTWDGTPSVTVSNYITRWRNKVCLQTDWSSVGGGVYDCPSAYYGAETNITAGAMLQICSGGC